MFYLVLILFFLFLPYFIELCFSEKTLNIYAFSEYISFESIKEFEKLYGVKVSIKNFETNEELLVKFKITGGEGYDLITPSDYTVELLRKEGLLHKLDLSKLPIIQELDEQFLQRSQDPGNHYSIPFVWNTYGVVFKKDIFKTIPSTISLDLLFEKKENLPYQFAKPYNVCMVDDAIEACFLTGLYCNGDIHFFDHNRLEKIKNKLISQRKFIAMYVAQDLRYYLFSDIFTVAITTSMNMKRILEERDDFAFMIPQEGCLMSVESLAIPAQCKKIDLVYKFINFILSKEVAALNSSLFGYNPTNKQAYELIDKRFRNDPNFFPDQETFARLHQIHNNIPLEAFDELWVEVKSS